MASAAGVAVGMLLLGWSCPLVADRTTVSLVLAGDPAVKTLEVTPRTDTSEIVAGRKVPVPGPVVLGLSAGDADKHNGEFRAYDRMIPVYGENGIRAALLEASLFYDRECPEERLLAIMKQFHVVHLTTTEEGITRFDERHKRLAAVVGRVLARYVEEGGGLFIQPQPVRYPGDDDERYWNAMLAPLGAKILHEGIFDKTRTFQGQTLGKADFWHTRNIVAHPVTKGVTCLCLPLHGFGEFPGVPAMEYGPPWQVLVRGEREARSYRSNADNVLDLGAKGSYGEAPPVLAVRSLGKGRIACYAIATLFTGMNHRNPLWADIVECRGDRAAGRPSHSMTMQMNAYRWLAEPSAGSAEFGTHVDEPYEPVRFPGKIDWDVHRWPAAVAGGIRGVFGAHSGHSDGSGTVADYVRAAKAAGLSFLVFADPLEQLTEARLRRLKADCAEASARGDFYACPGIEFTDGAGNRWAFWGESLVWPETSFSSDKFIHVQWDGRRMHHYGKYAVACQFPGSALLDYAQLRRNGAHPENLWWFYHYLPLVYEKDRLIADNQSEYLFGLRDMRWAAVASFTRIRAPADVASAAGACFTGMKDLPSAKAALNTRCVASWAATQAGQYVSQGPVIAAWEATNAQMESNWSRTRGAQRVRLRFVVRSEAGIAEVRVHDADRGPIRRFLGRGAKELSRQFELVHDQQHYLTLEVLDTAGRKAISHYVLLYCYKGGLFRCGDNLNILGPTAMCWHPDRNEFFNAAKDFRNGSDFCLRGWDTASATLGVPTPQAQLWDMSNVKEAPGGRYPDPYRLGAIMGRLMDVGVNGHNLQIATMRMTRLSEAFDKAKRPTPALATVARDVADLEYFDRTHTLYAPMERVDMYVTWNYRRDREGRKDYRGAILWHEGEIRFKKDCTLQGAVPIPLVWDRSPTDLSKDVGAGFVVTDADGATRRGQVCDEKQPLRRQGRIRPGGYAALLTTPVGYHGLLVPADIDFAYEVEVPSYWPGLVAGLGRDGQRIKAGTALRYRFGVGTFTADQPAGAALEHTAKAMNLGGGLSGYPVEMKTGTAEDAVFFFTVRAKENEAAFVLGPQELIIDLPIRVRGLDHNGCAAVYSTRRPWFRFIPVDAEGTAWFQEPIDEKNQVWVGNVLVCDNKDVKITLVADGQTEGELPFVEVHNPADQEITASLHSPAGAPVFGGLAATVKLPPGDSVRLRIHGRQFDRY
jgi:hypothetical protein